MFFKQLATKDATLSYFFGCGGRKLTQMVGAPYDLHESSKGHVKFAFEPLGDGQSLDLGNVAALHTPACPDSICLLVTDMRRGGLPWFVVTGDTLLVGSIGRSDFPALSMDKTVATNIAA